MAKKKEIIQEEAPVKEANHTVSELTTSFSNGEVNELKEKLNELIRATR